MKNTGPIESFVSFENMVKDCQVELIETLFGDCDTNNNINWIEVMGEVNVRALIPGDNPKVQVKLALPEDYDEFTINSKCVTH